MERKFKITVDGREYSVTVEEQTDLDSVPSLRAADQSPAIGASRSYVYAGVAANSHATHQVPAEPGDVVSTLGGVVKFLLVAVGQEIKAGAGLSSSRR